MRIVRPSLSHGCHDHGVFHLRTNEHGMKRNHEEAPGGITRRTFFERIGLGGLLLGITGLAYQSLRALIPNVLYEPALKFKIGSPSNLAEGMTFLEDKRLYVFREGRSFHA